MRTYQVNPDGVGVADPSLGFSIFISMEQNQNAVAPVPQDYGAMTIKRMDELCQVGLTMPTDYNYVNAIKASMITLQGVVDKNNRPALEVCTPQSITKALFKMTTRGLDVSKNQAYFVVKGNELCLDDSYFGKVLQVKRIYPDFDPIVNIIYDGDEFSYATDPKTLHKEVVKHVQTLESLDKDWKAAYMYLPCADGGRDLYIMTKRQIMNAWSKSPSGASVAKIFPEKMIRKTVINTGCNMIINSTPSLSMSADNEFEDEYKTVDIPAHEVVDIDVDAAPVVEAPKETKKNEVPPIKGDINF